MNLESVNKWLDEEYGISYTRLEELHDFVIEQDMKHQEEKDKEIDRLNNIIKDLIKDIEIISECEDINIIKMQLRTCLYNKLKELKENK